jgi:hypothetical protein
MSTVNRLGGGPSTSHADAGPPSDLGIDLQSVRSVGNAFVSKGHFAGRWNAQVAVNDTARSTYTNLGASSRFAVGSLLVKKHATPSAPGPIFAMAKRDLGFFPEGSDWEYVVIDAAGRLEERGKLPLCARCHAEGNADAVFGLPLDGR